MQILDISTPITQLDKPSAIALGMFDGVHLGHKQVVQVALDYAQQHNINSAVITLANHPRELTKGSAPKLITNLDTRLALFEELGIDYALVLEFNQELMNTNAEDYLQRYLVDILNVEFISTGYDHHFGKGRAGTPAMLQDWCLERNIGLKIVDVYKLNDTAISSSEIRDLIKEGKVREANQMLGYNFMIISKVIEGDRRGQELGFPTANLKFPDAMVVPAIGVYSGSCQVLGKKHQCVINIGTRPSFTDSEEVIIEAHLLDFDKDIYGETISLNLEKRIRDERKFDNSDALVEQIKKDIASCSCMK